MDPDANLTEQLRLVARILDDHEHGIASGTDAARLAELVEALHGWLSGVGFLPRAWWRPLTCPTHGERLRCPVCARRA